MYEHVDYRRKPHDEQWRFYAKIEGCLDCGKRPVPWAIHAPVSQTR